MAEIIATFFKLLTVKVPKVLNENKETITK
jgi:hypothetical protein